MDAQQWQITSTIVQAVSAVVLVVITGWYAYLTKRLASSAEEQTRVLSAQIAAGEERAEGAHKLQVKRALAAMQRVGAALEQLPTDAGDAADAKLRGAPLWEISTISAVERYGLRLALLDDDDTAQFSEDMTWLLARVREVRRVSRSTGVDYSKFEWAEWTERKERSQDLLARAVSDIKDYEVSTDASFDGSV